MGGAGAAHRGRGKAIRRIGCADKNLSQPQRQPAEMVHSRQQHRQFMGADHHCRLEVDCHQRDSQLFAGQPRAEGGARRQQQIRPPAGIGEGLDRLEMDFAVCSGEFEDHLRPVIQLPKAGIRHEALKFLPGAEGHDAQAGGTGRLFEEGGSDERHLVATRAEVAAEPNEGEDITGTAKGEEGNVHFWGAE